MRAFGNITKALKSESGTLIEFKTDENVINKLMRYSDGKDSLSAEIVVNDERLISSDQRKKIYATIKDIAFYTGDVPDFLKEYFKYDFCTVNDEEYFSLSSCSVTTAREFINHLIEFAISWDIPLTDLALNRTDDIETYLYLCLKYRRCAITGKHGAEVHHVLGSRVGMGRNRRLISHRGLELIALSSEWHKLVHASSEEEIFKKFKIFGIAVDDTTLRDLNLNLEDVR